LLRNVDRSLTPRQRRAALIVSVSREGLSGRARLTKLEQHQRARVPIKPADVKKSNCRSSVSCWI